MIKNTIRHISLLCLLALTACNSTEKPQANSNDNYSGDIERFYVQPTRIVTHTAQVQDTEYLLDEGKQQAFTSNKGLCIMKNEGNERAHIVLDFGQEWHGGICIITGMNTKKEAVNVRIRLGESVAEAMSELGGKSNATNDHAIRDWTQALPWCGKVELGNSGFRFASIELLDNDATLKLREVSAVAIEREIPYLGSFECNDERLNKIWYTGARTVHLNMQEYLWDGPKRDRLVWVGDMHPEVMTILSAFGANEVVPKSLDFIKDTTPLAGWMNGISSYSMWWLIIQHQWYMNVGDKALLTKNKDYILGVLDHLAKCIDEDGKENLNGVRFLDWPTKADSVAVHAGLQSMMVMTFDIGEELATLLDAPVKAKEYKAIEAKLRSYTPALPSRKSPAALMVLADLADADAVADDLLLVDGVQDLSTFYGYYVLNALAESGDYEDALDYIREYWGAMLDLGATTFWEDFDIDWMKNAARIDEIVPADKVDVHSTYGGYCYKGLRHSLCHGWASGPTAWLSEYVLGVEVTAPGCTELTITPHLGDLEWAVGDYPTPMGVVHIEHHRDKDGTVDTEVDAPEGVRVVLREV